MRFVLVPLGTLLIGLGLLQLVLQQVGLAMPLVGIATGLAFIALCVWDPPPEVPVLRQPIEPAAPGTERRVTVAYWLMLVILVGAAIVSAITGWSGWLLTTPLVPLFATVTVLQARAEKVSTWTVFRRTFRSDNDRR